MPSAPHRLIALLGLGFGDCGKGLFTDALTRRWQAHTVVRFNGGAQAGHNVVLPDGRHHTFSQFGAGTLVPGTATVLAHPVVVHPSALLVEESFLRRAGVTDALARLLIDARCRINTPFHQAAGRLRELHRGAAAHGTCGVGVGETVRHCLRQPDAVLRYRDLSQPALALEKLDVLRHRLLEEFNDSGLAAAVAELRVLRDAGVARRWLEGIAPLTSAVAPASRDVIGARLNRPGTVLFEGAQGVLLDEWRGFHPHTSWSTVHPHAVRAVADDAGVAEPLMYLGVLRTYPTRHGAGPFPTHDPALDGLAEPHNTGPGWQGPFRRGQPDALLLRYALAVTGPLDGLLLSHADVFSRYALRWCSAYRAVAAANDAALCRRDAAGLVRDLRLGAMQDLPHQTALTRLLEAAIPEYEAGTLQSLPPYLERVEALAGCKALWVSSGPTHESVHPPHAAAARMP